MQRIYHTLTSHIFFFENSFFSSAVIEWNKLESSLPKVDSFIDFKKIILSFIIPKENTIFNCKGSKGQISQKTSTRVKSLKRKQIQTKFSIFPKSPLLL